MMFAVRTAITLLLLLLLAPVVAASETILLEATQDATLIEDPSGALANGSGPVFFVGRTNQREQSVRRSLLRFDVAAALPKRARVERARLVLAMQPSNTTPHQVRVHRLLAGWGEGDSFASGGGGARSQPGDATWIHRFYDDVLWVRPGGQFVARASASREVAASGPYTWGSTRKLVADVRLWLAAPRRNFGWILIGDESTPQNVKAFASREEPNALLRPVLELDYRLPGRP
jgi:hypothetical protein